MPAAPPLLGSTGSTTFVLAALLVGLGLVMLGAAVWLVKATRTDVPALGPLEIVGDRRFAWRDPESQAAALTAARPEGALGPAPMVEIEDVAPEPAEPVEPVEQVEPVVATADDDVADAPVAPDVAAVEPDEPAGAADQDEVASEPAEAVVESEVVEAGTDVDGEADDAEANERAEAAPQSS